MDENKVDKKAEMEYINLCNEVRSTYRLDTDGVICHITYFQLRENSSN